MPTPSVCVKEQRVRLRQLATLLGELEESERTPSAPSRAARPQKERPQPEGCLEWAKKVLDPESLRAAPWPAAPAAGPSSAPARGRPASAPLGGVSCVNAVRRATVGLTRGGSCGALHTEHTAPGVLAHYGSEGEVTSTSSAGGSRSLKVQRVRSSRSRTSVEAVEAAMENVGPPELPSPLLEGRPLRLIFDHFFPGGGDPVNKETLSEVVKILGMRAVEERIIAVYEAIRQVRYEFCDFEAFVQMYWEQCRNESLASIFSRFRYDGEVHRDSLKPALAFMNVHAVQEWIDEVVGGITQYSTLDFSEFIRFVNLYWNRLQESYAKAFQECDQDDSGSIDLPELASLLSLLGIDPLEPVMKEIFNEVDEDGSGTIELAEFQKVVNLLHLREGFTKAEYERLMSTFNTFDWDRSGTVSKQEILKTLEYLHYSLSEEQATELFVEVDIGEMGELGEHEYLVFMRRVREHEIRSMTDILLNSMAVDREEALISLLTKFGHIPDTKAVEECAEAVGIDLAEGEYRPGDQPTLAKVTSLDVRSFSENRPESTEKDPKEPRRSVEDLVSRTASAPPCQGRPRSSRPSLAIPAALDLGEHRKSVLTTMDLFKEGVERRTSNVRLSVSATESLAEELSRGQMLSTLSLPASRTASARPSWALLAPATPALLTPGRVGPLLEAAADAPVSWRAISRIQTPEAAADPAKPFDPRGPGGAAVEAFQARQNRRSTATSSSAAMEPLLTVGQAWTFLELYRGREGLTMGQLEENRLAFNLFAAEQQAVAATRTGASGEGDVLGQPRHDSYAASRRESDGSRRSEPRRPWTWASRRRSSSRSSVWRRRSSGGAADQEDVQIDVDTCGKALRWLGWNSSYELFMQITGDVDLDLSGCIDLMEFNKLVRMYNEREMNELQLQLAALGVPGGDFKADVSAEFAEKLLVRLGFSEGERMEVLQGLLLYDASHVCDVFQLVSAVRHLRHAARRTCRDNEGFSPGEVAKLEEAFSLGQAAGSNPRTGHVEGFGLTRLLTEHFTPKEGIKSVAWKQVLSMLPGYKTTRGRDMLTFKHFLQLKRMWRDREHQSKFLKEQAAIAKVCFTPVDVREFRAIFVENDIWYRDLLDYDVVQTILHRICILGDRLKQEFHSAWLKVMAKADGLCPDVMDFPEFLLLMRQLIDVDFAGIRNGVSK